MPEKRGPRRTETHVEEAAGCAGLRLTKGKGGGPHRIETCAVSQRRRSDTRAQ
jgi:hypothetical protein